MAFKWRKQAWINRPISHFQIPSNWSPGDVSIPENWPELCFRSTVNKKGEYEEHKLPTSSNSIPFNNKRKSIADS
eukprot:15362356-Ditylum_brightwellii.AAC.1